MKILFAASEAVPYAASGGLADVTGSLPKEFCKMGHDCRVVIPLYKSIPDELRRNMILTKVQFLKHQTLRLMFLMKTY